MQTRPSGRLPALALPVRDVTRNPRTVAEIVAEGINHNDRLKRYLLENGLKVVLVPTDTTRMNEVVVEMGT